MGNTYLDKELTGHIKNMHSMSKNELYKTYEGLIPDNASKDIDEVKIELAYCLYEILHDKEPDELERSDIYDYFMSLKMQDELRKYSHSKPTQRIIKRIYRES